MSMTLPVSEIKQLVVIDTAYVRDLLLKRYAPPEWAFMQEVAPRTGGGTRYADAVAVNLWNSRGHAVHGFEIKVSRSDWLRELKQPEKAEDVFQFCDYWFIVAPKGIVKDGELPPTWGLIEVRESGLVAKEAAQKLTPKPITREFFASLMRRGQEQLDMLSEQRSRLAVNKARNEIDERVEREVKQRTRRLAELEDQIAKFSKETGITFDRYSGPSLPTIKLAQKLERLDSWDGDGSLQILVELAAGLERAAVTVRDAIKQTGLNEDKP